VSLDEILISLADGDDPMTDLREHFPQADGNQDGFLDFEEMRKLLGFFTDTEEL